VVASPREQRSVRRQNKTTDDTGAELPGQSVGEIDPVAIRLRHPADAST
jgi:hypothetical protein